MVLRYPSHTSSKERGYRATHRLVQDTKNKLHTPVESPRFVPMHDTWNIEHPSLWHISSHIWCGTSIPVHRGLSANATGDNGPPVAHNVPEASTSLCFAIFPGCGTALLPFSFARSSHYAPTTSPATITYTPHPSRTYHRARIRLKQEWSLATHTAGGDSQAMVLCVSTYRRFKIPYPVPQERSPKIAARKASTESVSSSHAGLPRLSLTPLLGA